MFYEFALKDFSRELAVSSFTCAFKNRSAADKCLDERLSQLTEIAAKAFNTEPVDIKLSFEAYQLIQNTDQQKENRRLACAGALNLNRLKMLPIEKIISAAPADFNAKYSATAAPGNPIRIGDLFNTPETLKYGELLCLNRTLTIAEAAYDYNSIFSFNFFGGDPSNNGFFGLRRLHVATFL